MIQEETPPHESKSTCKVDDGPRAKEEPVNRREIFSAQSNQSNRTDRPRVAHLKSIPPPLPDEPRVAAVEPSPEAVGQSGGELVDTVVQLTGLPSPIIRNELESILENAGSSDGTLTLDELRRAMLLYLESFATDSPHPSEPSPFPKGL